MKRLLTDIELNIINELCSKLHENIKVSGYKIDFCTEVCDTSGYTIEKYQIYKSSKKIASVGVEYTGDLVFWVNGLDWNKSEVEEDKVNVDELINFYNKIK